MHCKVSVTAAPRRARSLVSVSFSGLPLSWPVLIKGLVVHYTTNCLISRSPILRRRSFEKKGVPDLSSYNVLFSVSRGYPLPKGRLTTCFWAVRRALLLWLACLMRILIAVTSSRINWNCFHWKWSFGLYSILSTKSLYIKGIVNGGYSHIAYITPLTSTTMKIIP